MTVARRDDQERLGSSDGAAAVDSAAGRPEAAARDAGPPAALPDGPPGLWWIRFGLWAFLVMVLVGLAAVWLHAGRTARGVTRAELPVLGQVGAFSLVERSGAEIGIADLIGRPWVADAIFTRCAVSCPRMTSRMRALAEKLPEEVRLVSVTVDPAHDTPEVLAEYATRYGITGDRWLFLTGPADEIEGLVVGSFRLGVSEDPEATGVGDSITHSTRFVLVDEVGAIRGYYDGFDETSFEELVAAATAIGAER